MPAHLHIRIRTAHRPPQESPHTKSLPAPAPDSATAKRIAAAPSLPWPLARPSNRRSPPTARDQGFPAPPFAARAGTACPALAADAQSPRARSLVFLPSASEDDPIFARTQ